MSEAKAWALRRHEDEIREFRGRALGTIEELLQLHGETVPSVRIRDILKELGRAIETSQKRYEALVQQIEEAYK